ncbi:MAG: hypothetical protein EPN94_06120 [Nitrospirae bacterium]|nr:MAG: hypothetical protein EPN94_06120 [Nitrospirota bacterium]
MLKLRHIGGERVKGGNYWNFSTGERITVETGGILPGNSSITYYKAHPIVILLAGPALGLVYAAFLPFIGIAVLLKVVMTKLFGGVIEGVSKLAVFNWRPSEAYLAGKRHKKDAKDKEAKNGADKGTGDSE